MPEDDRIDYGPILISTPPSQDNIFHRRWAEATERDRAALVGQQYFPPQSSQGWEASTAYPESFLGRQYIPPAGRVARDEQGRFVRCDEGDPNYVGEILAGPAPARPEIVWDVRGTGYSSSYVPGRPATAEEQQAHADRLARAREADEEWKAAGEKAKELLISHLDEVQKMQLSEEGLFMVEGSSGGVYVIDCKRDVFNVKDWNTSIRYCAAFSIWSDLPRHDQYLAQKLLIEADEPQFLRVANEQVSWPPLASEQQWVEAPRDPNTGQLMRTRHTTRARYRAPGETVIASIQMDIGNAIIPTLQRMVDAMQGVAERMSAFGESAAILNGELDDQLRDEFTAAQEEENDEST